MEYFKRCFSLVAAKTLNVDKNFGDEKNAPFDENCAHQQADTMPTTTTSDDHHVVVCGTYDAFLFINKNYQTDTIFEQWT